MYICFLSVEVGLVLYKFRLVVSEEWVGKGSGIISSKRSWEVSPMRGEAIQGDGTTSTLCGQPILVLGCRLLSATWREPENPDETVDVYHHDLGNWSRVQGYNDQKTVCNFSVNRETKRHLNLEEHVRKCGGCQSNETIRGARYCIAPQTWHSGESGLHTETFRSP